MNHLIRGKSQSEDNACGLDTDELSYAVGGTQILRQISLEIPSQSGLSIVGPSGSGKTTLLRCLAGLDKPSSGSVRFKSSDGKTLTRDSISIGFVFQDLGIFERSTVEQNVFLGDRKWLGGRYADGILEILGLSDKLHRTARWLSGGERQRVAIARSLVRMPSILFLDEPFSNIDPTLSVELELLLAQLQHDRPFTLVYVTHNVESAMRMNPRLAFLTNGKVVQVGTPRDLNETPSSREILDFFSVFPAVKIGRAWTFPTRTSASNRSETAYARSNAVTLGARHPNPDDALAFCEVRLLKRLHTIPQHHFIVRESLTGTSFVAIAGGDSENFHENDELWASVDLNSLFTFPVERTISSEPSRS